MKKIVNEELDDFFNDDLLFKEPEFVSLNDDKNFEDYSDYDVEDDNIVTIDDSEFEKILNSLGVSDKKETPNEALVDLETEYAKLKLERETLEQEKKAFERQKNEWEVLRKLSEESFQAEKEEYAKKIKLEKEKMYLETRKIFNSCSNIKKIIDNYDN